MSYFDAMLDAVHHEMSEGPSTPAEKATHSVASRLNSIIHELDDLIRLSRDFDNPDAQQAIAAEWRQFGVIVPRAQLLEAFGAAMSDRPRGLRVVRGRASAFHSTDGGRV